MNSKGTTTYYFSYHYLFVWLSGVSRKKLIWLASDVVSLPVYKGHHLSIYFVITRTQLYVDHAAATLYLLLDFWFTYLPACLHTYMHTHTIRLSYPLLTIDIFPFHLSTSMQAIKGKEKSRSLFVSLHTFPFPLSQVSAPKHHDPPQVVVGQVAQMHRSSFRCCAVEEPDAPSYACKVLLIVDGDDDSFASLLQAVFWPRKKE